MRWEVRWIADDGTEFCSEQSCEDYEFNQRKGEIAAKSIAIFNKVYREGLKKHREELSK